MELGDALFCEDKIRVKRPPPRPRKRSSSSSSSSAGSRKTGKSPASQSQSQSLSLSGYYPTSSGGSGGRGRLSNVGGGAHLHNHSGGYAGPDGYYSDGSDSGERANHSYDEISSNEEHFEDDDSSPGKGRDRKNGLGIQAEGNLELLRMSRELVARGGPWKCNLCRKNFKLPYNLALHLHRGCSAVKCHWCKHLLLAARNRVMGPGGKHLCSQCGALHKAGYATMPCPDSNGVLKCIACHDTFEKMKGLSIHMRYCSGAVWACEWCACGEKQTRQKSDGPSGTL